MISLSLTHLILITVQFMEFSQIISLKFIFNNSTFAIFCSDCLDCQAIAQPNAFVGLWLHHTMANASLEG